LDYFIAIPSLGEVSITWSITFKELIIPGTYSIGCWIGLPVDVVRNRLVKDAQDAKAKFIFFLDSDVLPPADSLAMMRQFHHPIVTGIYWAKPGYPAVWRYKRGKYLPITNWGNAGSFNVDAAGAGCLLIDMRVFDVVPYPWFKWGVRDPRSKRKGLGEDFYFFRKAAKHGFPAICVPAVQCKHQGRSEMMPDGTYCPSV